MLVQISIFWLKSQKLLGTYSNCSLYLDMLSFQETLKGNCPRKGALVTLFATCHIGHNTKSEAVVTVVLRMRQFWHLYHRSMVTFDSFCAYSYVVISTLVLMAAYAVICGHFERKLLVCVCVRTPYLCISMNYIYQNYTPNIYSVYWHPGFMCA